MTYWVFTSQAEAEAAEALCFDHLPDDTLASGQEAPVQVTQRWAEIIATADGRWGFIACPMIPQPAGATPMNDADFAKVMPQPNALLSVGASVGATAASAQAVPSQGR